MLNKVFQNNLPQKTFRAIASDIDGTLLTNSHILPEKVKKAFRALQEMGVITTLVSARLPLSVLDVAKAIGINAPVLGLNGAIMVDYERNILYSADFPINSLGQVLDDLPNSVFINYYYGLDWFIKQNVFTSTTEKMLHAEIVENNFTSNTQEMLQFEIDCLGVMPKFIKEYQGNVNKVTVIGDRDVLLELQRKISTNYTELMAVFSHSCYLEITTKNISKASGVANFAKRYNLELEDFVVFGDGENDMSMLSQCGFGVAMDNAQEHIKSVANYVTTSNEDAGVADFINKALANNNFIGNK